MFRVEGKGVGLDKMIGAGRDSFGGRVGERKYLIGGRVESNKRREKTFD